MKFHQLFKDVFVYGLGDIVLKATAFITLPIYTRLFTPEDYGVWSFILTTVGLLGGMLALGGDSAYARFFFEAKTLQERQLITATWFSFLAAWSSGVVILLLPFSGLLSWWSFETEQYSLLFTMALLTAPLTLMNTMCGQVLRNQFQARLFTTLNVISTLLVIGLSLLGVVVLDLGLTGLLGGTLAGLGIMLPARLWTIRDMLRPGFSMGHLRKLLAFGVPLVPTSLAYWIFVSSDRVVLGKLSTLEQVGLYAIANNITSVLAFVNQALGQAWSPHVIQIYENQPKLAPVFFGRVATYILTGFGVLCVGIAVFAHEALILLSTPAFYPAAMAVGPLALGFMAYASIQVTASGISLAKQTKYFAIFSWLAALLNLGLNVLFIPRWGMIAASWTTAASYIFLTVAYLIKSQSLWPIVYEKRRALIAIALTFMFTTAAPFLPTISLAIDLVVKSSYCLIYAGLLIAFGVIDRREWQMLSPLMVKQEIATVSTAD